MSAQEQAKLLTSEAEVLVDALIAKAEAVASGQSQDDAALRRDLALLATSVSGDQLMAAATILLLVKRVVVLAEEVASVQTP